MKSSRKTEIMQNLFDYIARSDNFDYEDFKPQFGLTDTEIGVCAGYCPEDDDDDADDLVLYIKDGTVQEIKCSNPNMYVFICDCDKLNGDKNEAGLADEIGNQIGMYTIY